MGLRIPGLDLHEPLKSRPTAGLIHGAVAGAFLGLYGSGWSPDLSGIFGHFIAGGAAGGLAIGSALPLFRTRILAGAAVSVGMFLTLLIGWGVDTQLGIEVAVATAVTAGLVYALLLWDYRG